MEFFLKEHTFNQVILQSYNDYSRKVIMQRKYNQNAVLAKANPTSKACEKFLINAQLELKIELISLLINVLRSQSTSGPEREEFTIVGKYENWKKEEERLVLRTGEYGARELLLQKKTTVLPEEDMAFSDNPSPSQAVPEVDLPEVEWVDQYGSFYIKKTDSVPDMLKALNLFYSKVQPSGTTAGKKRKPTKRNKEADIGAKKVKPKDNKITIEDDEMCNDDECESIFFLDTESNSVYIDLLNNEKALLELAYFYDICELSLENCILCYHDQMNESINISNQINFFSLLSDLDELKKIEHVLNKIIKRKLFFFRNGEKKKQTFFTRSY